MRLTTRLTLEGVEIGQSGKPQRFPNKPHRSSAGNAARPLDHHFVRAHTQHKRLSGASIGLLHLLGTDR
jgi:hypothetical protein